MYSLNLKPKPPWGITLERHPLGVAEAPQGTCKKTCIAIGEKNTKERRELHKITKNIKKTNL